MQQLPIQTLPLAKPAAPEDASGRADGASNASDAGFDRALRQASDEPAGGRRGDASPRHAADEEQAPTGPSGNARGDARSGSGRSEAPGQDGGRKTARGGTRENPSSDGGARKSAGEEGGSGLRPGAQPDPAVDGARLLGGAAKDGAAEGLRAQLRALLADGGAASQGRAAADARLGTQAGGESGAADRAAQLRTLLSGQNASGGGNGQSGRTFGLSTGLTAAALTNSGNGEGQANGLPGRNGQQGASREALMRLLQGGQPVQARGGDNGAQVANQANSQRGGQGGGNARAAAEALEGMGRDSSARTDNGSAPTQSGPVSRGLETQGPRSPQASQTVPKAMVQVAREAADGQREVRLKLHPPHLGQVRVELQMADNRVQAIFHVDNRQAASMLDAQMHQLRTALQDQQLELEGSQVHLGDPGSGGDPRQFADDQAGEGGDRGWGRWRAFGGDDAGAEGGSGGGGPAESVRGLNLYA